MFVVLSAKKKTNGQNVNMMFEKRVMENYDLSSVNEHKFWLPDRAQHSIVTLIEPVTISRSQGDLEPIHIRSLSVSHTISQ